MSDPVLDEARLAAIQAAADQATLGEWQPYNWSVVTRPNLGRPDDETPRDHVAKTTSEADAAFIALARSAVPELLAHVGVLRADNQRLRDEVEALQRQVRTAEQWMGALPHIKPARGGGV